MTRLTLMVLLAWGLTGCTFALHVVDIQDIQPSVHSPKAVRVSADGEQFTVMGFVTETNYVDRAYADLQSKCPRGEITGITARSSTAHGFWSWTNKVHLSGWCVD